MHVQEDRINFKKYKPITYKEEGRVHPYKNTKKMAVRVQWIWSFMWLMVLVGVAWPLSLTACVLYITIIPFTACCDCTYQLTEFIHKGILLPQVIATYVVAGRSCDGL